MKLFARTDRYDEDDPHGAQGGSGSVEELVPVQSVFDNMMVLKDGSFRMVMTTNATNFELKSIREQRVILNTFGELLNTLAVDFPLQILLHAAHLDTGRYIRRYAERLEDRNTSPQMRRVIEEHIEYFEYQARAHFLLDRSFYIVIPFFGSSRQHLPDGGLASDLPGGGFLKAIMDGSDKERTRATSPRELEIARIQLLQRASQIQQQLSRLGLISTVLEQLELVQLLRELYNPGISERQGLRELSDIGSLIALPSESSPRTRQRHLGEGA